MIEQLGIFNKIADTQSSLKRNHTKLASTVADHQKDIEQHQHDIQHSNSRIADLEKRLHLMSTAPALRGPEEVLTSSRPFEGPIDATILRVETFKKVEITKVALKQYLDALYEDANVHPDKFTIEGEALDSRFYVQFSGTPGHAATILNQAITAHKHKSGKYRELAVNDPTGNPVRVFLNRDGNPS